MRSHTTRAFTLIEMAATTALGLVGVACFVAMSGAGDPPPPAAAVGDDDEDAPRLDKNEPKPPKDASPSVLASLARARASARQLKDSTQVRGILQSMVIFAQNNKDSYPLPSVIDEKNMTIALGEGENAKSPFSKNTTANIMSILIYNGNISTEICVSPAEVSRRIKPMETYAYNAPPSAAKPAEALWDPAFRADFTKKEGGNFSYAHLQPSANRRSKWSDTFNSTEAVLGNRAPLIVGSGSDDLGNYSVKLKSEKSKTFRIHGDPKTWEGNIAFNDGHVNFETSLAPRNPTPPAGMPASSWAQYASKDPTAPGKTQQKLDCFYYDEPDDSNDAANLYLGIWIKAGETAADFKGIWD